MSSLKKFQDLGFKFYIYEEKLAVTPFSKLTDAQREYIRQHKNEIVEELQKPNIDVFVYRIEDEPEKELIMIAGGVALEEAERDLKMTYGDRLLSVERKTVYKH